MSSPTRLLLVRHGDTDATASDRFSGDANVHLTQNGQMQVERLSSRLASEKLTSIYSSPLDRALESARILCGPHGLTPIPSDDLRELRHGHWEGLTYAEVKARYPDELAAWEMDPFTFAPDGGETGVSVLARALPALREMIASHPGETILIVSHKGTLRLALSGILGMDPRLYREHLDLAPASLSILDFADPAHAQLRLYNDVSHYKPW